LPLSADHADPFPTPSSCPSTWPARIAAGDFNGDGRVDIAGIDANRDMRPYTGTGTGTGTGTLSGGALMWPGGGLWGGF
jgi:hypothetical protein